MTTDFKPNNPYRPGIFELSRIGLIAFTILGEWNKFWGFFPSPEMISLIVVLAGAYPIFEEALTNILARRMTMELSMAIAIVAALTIGEHLTALVIAFFVLFAEMLENMTVDRGRHAIKNLINLLPRQALVKVNGDFVCLGIDQLNIADVIKVKPGERIPVDGSVTAGNSFVDQSTITGESLPVEKQPGAEVYAGTINQSGVLEIRTERLGHDTAFGKIIDVVEKAEKSRAPIQKTADRLAGYLVYMAFGCAAFTFFFTHNIRDTISVIIVAGACGVAAGTPLAVMGAIGRAAGHGAIIKGGRYLEMLGKINTVVFDKTGTVTLGNPKITKIINAPGISMTEVLKTAAIAERFSEHPVARAILKKAVENNLALLEPEEFKYIPGKGIICRYQGEEIVVGKKSFLVEQEIEVNHFVHDVYISDVFVARGKRILGAFRFEDPLRPNAAETIRALRRMNIQTILLTGDTWDIAQNVGQKLGFHETWAELLPEQKSEKIQELRNKKRFVAMIGDGINDAPALMQTHIGVAMGSGTDVAQESANILLIGNDLLKFVETVKLARRCHNIIMFNFAGTVLVDGIGVVMAALGYLNPVLAAFIHVSSELIFILNSARLLSYPLRK